MATAVKLRSTNYKSMEITAPTGGVSAGDMIEHGDVVGIVMEDADAAAAAVLIYEAERIIVPKEAGVTLVAGDKVYYDAATAAVNVDSGENPCGRATAAAASAATTCEIQLMGSLPAGA